jgi:hypothetical protein
MAYPVRPRTCPTSELRRRHGAPNEGIEFIVVGANRVHDDNHVRLRRRGAGSLDLGRNEFSEADARRRGAAQFAKGGPGRIVDGDSRYARADLSRLRTVLRAWSGITGWRFESSSAHCERPANRGLPLLLGRRRRTRPAVFSRFQTSHPVHRKGARPSMLPANRGRTAWGVFEAGRQWEEPTMAKARTLVGLDVHATKIVAAALDGETSELEFSPSAVRSANPAGLCSGLPTPVRRLRGRADRLSTRARTPTPRRGLLGGRSEQRERIGGARDD